MWFVRYYYDYKKMHLAALRGRHSLIIVKDLVELEMNCFQLTIF